MSMKNSNDTIGNRTRDLPACSAVPQPSALPGVTDLPKNMYAIKDSKMCHFSKNRATPNLGGRLVLTQ